MHQFILIQVHQDQFIIVQVHQDQFILDQVHQHPSILVQVHQDPCLMCRFTKMVRTLISMTMMMVLDGGGGCSIVLKKWKETQR